MQELKERESLLERIRPYVDEHGITTLTFDALARWLGVSVEYLHGFFETKADLVVALVARDRVRQREAFARIDADASMSRLERSRALWRVFLDAPDDSCLLFESYGLGFGDPAYRAFLHGVDDWVGVSEAALIRDGFPREAARAFATLALAVHRGAMLDLCATGDRARVNAAMELWFASTIPEMDARDA